MMVIKYISDLHFDYYDNPEQKENEVIKQMNKKDLYLIAGDFYNNFEKTLAFVKKVDKAGIHGYWILGNHEFSYLFEPLNVNPKIKDLKIWKDSDFKILPESAYDGLINVIKELSKENKNFKFLTLGDEIKLGNGYTLIGDTAWGEISDPNNQWEWNHVTNWKWVKERSEKWIEFMNKKIKENNKLIIMTHHPLYGVPKQLPKNSRFLQKKSGEICFWFPNAKLKIGDSKKDVIFIHGHTHDNSYKSNHLTNAIGRGHNVKPIRFEIIDLK